jgi:hypothetical protein
MLLTVRALAIAVIILLGPFGNSVFCRAAQVTLAWDASTDPTIVGYNVYYGQSSGTYTNQVFAGQHASSVVSNLAATATYYFAATAVNAAGLESLFSSEVVYQVPAPVAAPGQSLLLSWPPIADTISVYITSDLVNWAPLTNISGSSGSLTISQQPGTHFFTATASGPAVTNQLRLTIRKP